MKITTNAASELATATDLLEMMNKIEKKAERLNREFRFLTVENVMELTGYSKPTVLAIFNRPDFPACDYGKQKIVFLPAFYDYFMKAVKKSD